MQGFGRRLQRYRLVLLCACGIAWIAIPALGAEPGLGDDRPVVLFLGDSLTAGYGLAAEEAFPARIQQRIDAAGLDFRVMNAGVSGDTSAGGLRRVDWLLQQPVAILVLELGANDMLRGQSVESMRSNLRGILDKVRAARPEVRFVIAGMRAAPNLGPAYGREFEQSFELIASEYDAALIPFVLDGVAGNEALTQPDGLHPTALGCEHIAIGVWEVMGPLLKSMESP
jgi:acyl-CoA thioesterase-1